MLSADADDQMRLVQVRDWLAGQGWFDTRQHRVRPPDGISMHWTRYVDLGIAAILTVASPLLAPEAAERATVFLWPSLLACLMVVVHARGAGCLMGPAVAPGRAGGLALAAPLLLAGQTAPLGWATPSCDVLAPPVLALGAVGSARP